MHKNKAESNLSTVFIFVSCKEEDYYHQAHRVGGGGGSRGSNEPPKIFEVGIFGELKR